MKRIALIAPLAALTLAGCMGNTASTPGMGSAIAQAAASQAIASSVGQGGATGQIAALPNGAMADAAAPATNIYTPGYASYSCEQLATLITSLEPYQSGGAAAGLSTVAGLAGLFGRGSSSASGAAALLGAQANVSQQQQLQLQAARGVAQSKGC